MKTVRPEGQKSPTLKIISHGQLNDKILKKYKLSLKQMDLNWEILLKLYMEKKKDCWLKKGGESELSYFLHYYCVIQYKEELKRKQWNKQMEPPLLYHPGLLDNENAISVAHACILQPFFEIY